MQVSDIYYENKFNILSPINNAYEISLWLIVIKVFEKNKLFQ